MVIFAREPKKGKVKTRLASRLSQTECLRLYKRFLRDTVSLARNINCSRRIIAFDSDEQNPSFLKKIASDFGFYRQKGRYLGERMLDVFNALAATDMKIVIIGSDSPGLPGSYISRAFDELNKKDIVLGPAYDGGYYLIGLKKPCRAIFAGVKWGASSVFAQTLKKAKELKMKIAVLGSWYDIDTPQDLKYLQKGFSHEI